MRDFGHLHDWLRHLILHQMISGVWVYLIGWFVGGTGCTLQTLYAWLMRGFGIGMVGILIYRVLRLSL